METKDSIRENVIAAFNAYTFWFTTLPEISTDQANFKFINNLMGS